MKMLEIFIEWLDNIYFQGYAAQLSKDDPDAYAWEYHHFIENY